MLVDTPESIRIRSLTYPTLKVILSVSALSPTVKHSLPSGLGFSTCTFLLHIFAKWFVPLHFLHHWPLAGQAGSLAKWSLCPRQKPALPGLIFFLSAHFMCSLLPFRFLPNNSVDQTTITWSRGACLHRHHLYLYLLILCC